MELLLKKMETLASVAKEKKRTAYYISFGGMCNTTGQTDCIYQLLPDFLLDQNGIEHIHIVSFDNAPRSAAELTMSMLKGNNTYDFPDEFELINGDPDSTKISDHYLSGDDSGWVRFDLEYLAVPFLVENTATCLHRNIWNENFPKDPLPMNDDKGKVTDAFKERYNKFMSPHVKEFRAALERLATAAGESQSYLFIANFIKLAREESPNLDYVRLTHPNTVYLDWSPTPPYWHSGTVHRQDTTYIYLDKGGKTDSDGIYYYKDPSEGEIPSVVYSLGKPDLEMTVIEPESPWK